MEISENNRNVEIVKSDVKLLKGVKTFAMMLRLMNANIIMGSTVYARSKVFLQKKKDQKDL